MAKLCRFFFVILLFGLIGCGGQGGGGGGAAPATTETVSAIELLANAPVVGTNEATAITVRLYNASGQLLTGQKTVTFSVDNPALGSIEPIVSTATGVATATFNSRAVEGSVVVTATVDEVNEDLTIQVSDLASPASIGLSSSPTSLTVGGTSVFKARVLDSVGNPLPDGTLVTFSVNNSSLGNIVPSASVSGGNGEAQATFSASTEAVGTVTVTARCGSVSSTLPLTIMSSPSGSIEFLSANPQIIVIRGAGGIETSEVKFLVKDVNGVPVLGSQTVRMTLSGPNGGEFLNSVDVGTVNGVATVLLNSGTIPGTVTITATILNTNISTSSGVIAIGGGIPSATHFSLSATKLKLEGFDVDGLESSIDVRLADRYGNYNVLTGTAVSFYSECGAIDRAINLNNEGFGTVRFRTQEPRPQELPIDSDIKAEYFKKLGVELDDSKNPQNGICTIVAVVDGEERFIDGNANGLYDVGETFYDTYDDVHLDKDDDSIDLDVIDNDNGLPHDATFEELLYDRGIGDNSIGVFNGKNEKWDANKKIVKHFKIGLTYDRSAPDLTIAQKSLVGTFEEVTGNTLESGLDVNFAIHDSNFNDPIAGTTYEITVVNVQPPSTTKHTFTDNSATGATVFNIKPVIMDETKPATLTIKWSWKGTDYSQTFTVI